MKRWKELEKAVERVLAVYKYQYLRISNYRCYKCGTVQNSAAKGFPDFFCYYPNIVAIEAKTGKGRLTKEQKIVKEYMEETGIKYILLKDTVDELLKVLDELDN